MRFLPQFNQLGPLELIEIYEFYDKPLLVSCRNATGQLFLSILVDEDEAYEVWYFLAVSERRFQHIRSGHIDLFSAFFDPEDGYLQEVRVSIIQKENMPQFVKLIWQHDLSHENLPLPGEFLQIDTETLVHLDNLLTVKADQSKREYLRLHLEFANIHRTEAPAKKFAEILYALQETVDALGQSIAGNATRIGAIPKYLRDLMGLNLVDVGAGSFEVELASVQMVDMFDESSVGRSIKELFDLIGLGADETLLTRRLQELQIRVAAKYASLLKTISDDVSSTEFEWATPKQPSTQKAEMSAESAKLVLSVIEQTQFEPPQILNIRGRLIGANLDKKNYEIWAKGVNDKNVIYSGRATDSALDSLAGAVLGQEYDATIRQLKVINLVTADVDEKNELLSLT